MKRRSHKMMFWGGLILNSLIILACFAKFLTWDIRYYLASKKTLNIWQSNFNISDYPGVGDTYFTLALVCVFGLVELYLIHLQKIRKVD